MTQLKRVVVTGLGALTPIGNNVSEYWANLLSGQSGAAPITHFDASNFKTQFACEVKNFNATDYIDRKEARKQDPYTQYAVVATSEAMQDSNIDLAAIDLDRAGVIWGSGIGGIKTFYDEVSAFAKGDGTPRFNPFFIPKMISDIAAGVISIKYGFRGPNFTTVSACASSSNAIIDSFNYIRLGKADIIITGGSEASVNEAGLGGFNAIKALSTRNENPEKASRPFDKDRDGFVMGEGAAAIVLERESVALARGARVMAEMAGFGYSADAYRLTAPHPEGTGMALAMQRAIDDAGMEPTDIDYVNAHGTSTPVGDMIELGAINKVFGAHRPKVASTKSLTGHSQGATGAHEAIYSLLMLENDFIAASANIEDLDPEAGEGLLHAIQDRVVAAARAPADLLVRGKILLLVADSHRAD